MRRESDLTALIAQWRERAENWKQGESYGEGQLILDCADELAAVLARSGAGGGETRDLSWIADFAQTYMRELMAMPDYATDQEQNFILGHMVTFAHHLLSSARPAPQGWQPIETAPKDGTPVWCIEDGILLGLTIPHQFAAYWHGDYRYQAGGCWLAVDRECAGAPTHWQPLPDSPAVSGVTTGATSK